MYIFLFLPDFEWEQLKRMQLKDNTNQILLIELIK